MMTPEQQEADSALQAALQEWAHVNDVVPDEAFLDSWMIIGTAVDPSKSDRTLYWRGFSGGTQALHITAGLIRFAQVNNDAGMCVNNVVEGGDNDW